MHTKTPLEVTTSAGFTYIRSESHHAAAMVYDGPEFAEEMVRRWNAFPALVDALSFYVSICGNTAWSVSRETAAEMYEAGKKALAAANPEKV